MTAVQQFEDLLAWQKARSLAGQVYRLSADGPISKDFGFRDQFRRAAISVMNNIAEGFGRRGDKEFANFLRLAKGSVAEVQSMIYIGLDIGYLSEEEADQLRPLSREVAAVVTGLIAYLSQAKVKAKVT